MANQDADRFIIERTAILGMIHLINTLPVDSMSRTEVIGALYAYMVRDCSEFLNAPETEDIKNTGINFCRAHIVSPAVAAIKNTLQNFLDSV